MQNIADAYHVEVNEIRKRVRNENAKMEVSDWAAAVARRLERRTAGMSAEKRASVEHAIDSILTVAAGP
jgi:hypothetical protein